jgi:hypothetical protein
LHDVGAGFEPAPTVFAALTSLVPDLKFALISEKGGEGGMKLGKEALAKEAAFWGQIKKVEPRKVCHK